MPQLSIKEIRERFSVARSADIFDVMDKMGYGNQCMDLNIRPLREDMKVIGPAFTVLGTREPRYGEELPIPEVDSFAILQRMYQGCVIVLNSEGDRWAGHWGEMMSYGARNSGATGIVIDGGTRDKEGVLRIKNWACFARYTSPIESEKRWRPKEVEVPIYVSGTLTSEVRVNPGDWIFGDVDGVIVIPKNIVFDVLTEVEDLSHREEMARQELANGASFKEVFAKYQRA